ncbi:hypothetical protein HDU87_001810 [Geranomyces variabilis]|uniref:Uncharacterized protein n=1 Tax=Geranomyces variabilis TaxID=109894 RepID=A0AAD5TM03_9FUNG|nr:hypothetical protein HDU87_001810 [Geranomyces variabilis]
MKLMKCSTEVMKAGTRRYARDDSKYLIFCVPLIHITAISEPLQILSLTDPLNMSTYKIIFIGNENQMDTIRLCYDDKEWISLR